MPNLPDRDKRAADLAKRLSKLGKKQLARVKAAMGQPSDPARIPPALWAEIEREQREESKLWMIPTFLVAAKVVADLLDKHLGYQAPQDRLKDAAEAWAEQRAAELAKGFVDHSRQRVAAIFAPPLGAPVDISAPTFPADAPERLDKVFSPERFDGIGTTETTGAVNSGGRFTGETFERETGGKMLLIWRHRGALSKGVHPCPLCAPLIGTSQFEWAAIDPNAAEGPPLHVNCDCATEEMFLTADEWALQYGGVPRPADVTSYATDFKRIAHSRGPRDK